MNARTLLYSLVPLALATLPIMACQSDVPTAHEAEAAIPAWQALGRLSTPENFADLSAETLRHRAHTGLDEAVRLRRIVTEAPGWRTAHEGLQAALAEPTEAYQPHREEIAAALILSEHLLRATATPAVLEATAHYTERLVANGSPEILLIEAALVQLDGFLPEPRRAILASQAADAAKLHLARRADCMDCSLEQILERFDHSVLAENDRYLIEAVEAVKRLSAFREDG